MNRLRTPMRNSPLVARTADADLASHWSRSALPWRSALFVKALDMRDVPNGAASAGTKCNEVGRFIFGEQLLKLRETSVHVRSAISSIERAGMGRCFNEIQDDCRQVRHELIHIHFKTPVGVGITTVAEAGGASSASGGGH